MLTQTQQVDLTLHHLKERTLSIYTPEQRASIETSEDWKQFDRRLEEHFPKLMHELDNVYNNNEAVLPMLEQLIAQAWQSYSQRNSSLKDIDIARENDPDWILSNKQVGGVCYVDLFAGDLQGLKAKIPYFQELGLTYLHLMPLFKCPEGKSDGGYAVSSYRDVNPALGTIDDLRDVIAALHEAGISAVVDFIFNHTSNEHEWAKGCAAGNPLYDNFYYIFPDRWMPDQYDRTLREIFPDQHPGGFSQLEDGRWVWTTFNSFQWDLNYSNPWVFRAMAGEMMFLANLGVDILRMDAVAFIWKQMGTSCENLPQAHALIRAFNSVMRIAAPAVFFKSEAIVHPDQAATTCPTTLHGSTTSAAMTTSAGHLPMRMHGSSVFTATTTDNSSTASSSTISTAASLAAYRSNTTQAQVTAVSVVLLPPWLAWLKTIRMPLTASNFCTASL